MVNNITFDEKNKKQFITWLEALRSGKYKQTRDKLENRGGFCCLGVACDVLIPRELQKRNSNYYEQNNWLHGGSPKAQPNAPEWLKRINEDFGAITGQELTVLNDVEGFSFDEIADLLQAVYIENVLNLGKYVQGLVIWYSEDKSLGLAKSDDGEFHSFFKHQVLSSTIKTGENIHFFKKG